MMEQAPSREQGPLPSCRDQLVEFARHQLGDDRKVVTAELSPSTLLKIEADELWRSLGEAFPTVYAVSVLTKKGDLLASAGVTDGRDGFISVYDIDKEMQLTDDATPQEIDDILGEFMARWHITKHIGDTGRV